MFRNDLGYMKQNVKIVGRNGGFTYSDLGATHHSLEDYAIMRMIPGVVVLSPQSPLEIRLPGPLNGLKKPVLHFIKGTVIEKVLRDYDVLRDGMI